MLRLDATEADLEALASLITWDTVIENEALQESSLNELVPKPWGSECRVFADNFLDVWLLRISAGERTSLHAHVKKVTHLLCLSGEGAVRSLSGTNHITSGSIVTVAAGAFHSTRAIGGPLTLVEVETPRNKLDLVRLEDDYRRDTTQYEEVLRVSGASCLRKIPQMPGASIRPSSPDGHFRFDIEAGVDVSHFAAPGRVFFVPIGLRGLLHDDMTPLRAVDIAETGVDSRIHYLAISKLNTDARSPLQFAPDASRSDRTAPEHLNRSELNCPLQNRHK